MSGWRNKIAMLISPRKYWRWWLTGHEHFRIFTAKIVVVCSTRTKVCITGSNPHNVESDRKTVGSPLIAHPNPSRITHPRVIAHLNPIITMT